MSHSEYRKIEGIGNRWYSSHKLYANEHGLLLVAVSFSDERYRKIAFSDVCGFSITHSPRYWALTIVFGLLMLAFGGIYAAGEFKLPLLAGLAGVCGVVAIVNLVKGKTCRCVVSTKYTHARLRSLTRLKAAFRFRDYLRSQVERHQAIVESQSESVGDSDTFDESLLV